MEKHMSALEPRIETVVTPPLALESVSSAEAALAVPVEQLHSRALAALIGVIEEQWRFCDDDEESKSEVPRAIDCSQLTEDDDDYVCDHQSEEDLLLVDFDDMTINSLLAVTSTTTGKRRPSLESTTLKGSSPRVAAIKSFSIFCGEFPVMED